MASSSYAPGPWFAIIRSRTVVLLGPGTRPELVNSLWQFLETAPEVDEVLHEVTDSFGVSLSRIPPFGIIDFRDPLRVFLRGGLELTVRRAAGVDVMDGRDVTTWTERLLTAPDSFLLEIPDGGTRTSAGSAPQALLPVAEGVVMLSALSVSLTGARTSPARAAHSPAGAAHSFTGPPTSPAGSPVALAWTGGGGPVGVRAEENPVGEVDAAVSVETVMEISDDLELTIAPGLNVEEALPTAEDAATAAEESVPTAGDPAAEDPAAEDPAAEDTEAEDPAAQDPAAEDPAAEDPAATPEIAAPVANTAAPAGDETTSSYDHLWDKTVMRSIEDAAVRVDPSMDGPSIDDAEPGEPKVAPAGSAVKGSQGAQPPAGEAEPSHAQAEGAEQSRPWIPPSLGVPGLIESVPWKSEGKPRAEASDDASVPDGDHDGQTVMKSSLSDLPDAQASHAQPTHAQPTQAQSTQAQSTQAQSTQAQSTQARAPSAETNGGPTVLARVCGHGHANPPTHAQCASCGMALSEDAVQVPRPRLGRVRLSTGEVVDLDQSLIIGRQPSVSRVQGGAMPRLIQVTSPGGDISRSHVEVRLEGWHVMLCDLKATNGTVLVREGQAPRRLAQGEMAILLDGDIAELGEDIFLRFEEIL